jgi:hypothetical protein
MKLNKEILAGLICAGAMLLVSAAAKLAHGRGLIDADVAQRAIGLNGLLVAYLGNRVPKKVARTACARQVKRVSGWSMVLSGLLYTGLWAFAPIPVALVYGTGALFAGVLFTLCYCVWLDTRTQRTA